MLRLFSYGWYILFLFLSTRLNFFYYQSQLHIKREFFKDACWLITKYEDSHVTTADWMDHFEGLIASFTWNISYKKYVREFRLHFKWQFLKKTKTKRLMFAYTICRFTYHYVSLIVHFLKELLPFLTEEFLSNENSSKLCILGYCLLPYADLYMLVWWDYFFKELLAFLFVLF